MDTRIEIYKKQKWVPLRLKNDASIRYNAVINKIGKVASREISHTNTFSLPYVYENISALGLNNFNPAQMAQAMNRKYQARYYVEEKLVQSGFIVINNSRDGVIKVNFIDEALFIIEKWGSSSYEELLNNIELDIPQVYADAIAEMKTFSMTKTAPLGKLSEVANKGFNLAVFPNNLNQIGDKFQINKAADDRLQDVYNPYQTRPVYNVKAFLDMITLSYGYTPDYNNSVNWDRLEKTFITSESPDKNKKGENGLQNVTYPQITSSSRWRWITTFLGEGYISFVDTFFQGYSEQCIRPIDIPNWIDPEYWDSDNPSNSDYFYDNTWFEQYSVFQPNLDTGNFGTVRYTAAIPSFQQHIGVHELWFIYKNETLGGDVVINEWSSIAPDYREIEVADNQVDDLLNGDYIMGDIPGTFNSGTGTSVNFNPGGDFQFFYKTNGSTGWCVIAKRKTDGQFTSFADGSEWLLCQTLIDPATWNSSMNINGNAYAFAYLRMTDENFEIDNRFYGPKSGETNQDGTANNLLWSFDQDLTTGNFIVGEEFNVDLTFDKVFLDTPVNGAGDLIGIIYNYKQSFAQSTLGGLSGMVIEESFLPPGVVAFDKFGQYIPDVVDMTHGASKKTLKFILAGIMHKEGILMDINSKLKTIKFFSYSHYLHQQMDGNFSDWSNYLLEYDEVVRSTDYGNEFAQKNRIGLSSPFQGNTADVNLDNQGANTKYKDYAENYVKGFKDIQNVREINNTGADKDFFEYELKGLGMVESDGGSIPVMEQERADSQSQGTQVNEIDKMANVNYAELPEGVESWYRLVDEALKVEAMFMLSIDVFRNLDLSEPIFVEQLGGYYIIEEVSQYTNGSKPVKVKLIKLISSLTGIIVGGEEEEDDQEPDTTPEMTISARAILANPPFVTGNTLGAYSNINYFTPATATLVAKRVTGNPLIGQTSTYIGPTFTDAITISDPNNGIWTQSYYTFSDIPSSVAGWYEIQGFATGENSANRNSRADTPGPTPDELESNIEYVYFSNGDDIINDDPNLTMSEDKEATKALPSGQASFRYTVENMKLASTQTTRIIYEKYSETTTPTVGIPTILTIDETGIIGKQYRNVDITFANGPGFYKIGIQNDEAEGQSADIIYIK